SGAARIIAMDAQAATSCNQTGLQPIPDRAAQALNFGTFGAWMQLKGYTMVTLNRIYTKSGDKGETALGDGTRLPKHALRIYAYGTVDEANAAIGLARLHTSGDIDRMLSRIQNDLFDLGADLCVPETGRRGEGALRSLD